MCTVGNQERGSTFQRDSCAYVCKCGGLEFSPKMQFWFVLFFPPRDLCVNELSAMLLGLRISIWTNVTSCIGAQSTKGPSVFPTLFLRSLSWQPLPPFWFQSSFLFVLFFSFLLFSFWTAVVSNSCKRFANQNAMYSRYGLYFRFTALQTVCKYYQLNEGKQRRCYLSTIILRSKSLRRHVRRLELLPVVSVANQTEQLRAVSFSPRVSNSV